MPKHPAKKPAHLVDVFISVRLPQGIKIALEQEARTRWITRSKLVREIFAGYLSRERR